MWTNSDGDTVFLDDPGHAEDKKRPDPFPCISVAVIQASTSGDTLTSASLRFFVLHVSHSRLGAAPWCLEDSWPKEMTFPHCCFLPDSKSPLQILIPVSVASIQMDSRGDSGSQQEDLLNVNCCETHENYLQTHGGACSWRPRRTHASPSSADRCLEGGAAVTRRERTSLNDNGRERPLPVNNSFGEGL